MNLGSRPFSLSLYLGAFATLSMALLLLLAWLVTQRIDAVDRDLRAAVHASARTELEQVLDDLFSGIREAARDIAQWDEIRQQLRQPAYYAYWRAHRLHKPGTLPESVSASEIYDAEGKLLGHFADTLLPGQLPAVPEARVIQHPDGRPVLQLFQPIRDSRGRRLGWIGLQFELLPALQRAIYTYLDPRSLQVGPIPAEGIPPDRLVEHIRFDTRPSDIRQAMLGILNDSLLQIAVVVILIGTGLYLLYNLLISRPLQRMERTVRRLENDGFMELQQMRFPVLELETVRNALIDYHRNLEQAHCELDERNRELWRLAHRDPLTGVFNRRALDEDWRRMTDAESRYPGAVAFLLLDCDHFKAINDTYGHETGDEVLRRIALGVQHALRSSDRLYRLGGDEFAAVLVECNRECAHEVAQRCIKAVDAEDFGELGLREPVHLSIGIAVAGPGPLPPVDTLKRMADMAMYHAKRPNRHRIQFYDDEMDRDGGMLYSSRIVHAVEHCLRNRCGIEMHYQPVVDLEAGDIGYREALARIRIGEELLMPGQFMPVIEAHRLESDFDLAVIEAIRRDAEQGRLPPDAGISVNVSGMGITRKDVMEALGSLAGTVVGRPLVLEITETTYIDRIDLANRQIRMARGLGYRIALDDFGSGYSSLRYLATMPFDIVKFDISMTRQLNGRESQRMITERMVKMLTDAGYYTVAEGIEDADTLKRVRDAGFAAAQGFHLGRPRPLPHSDQGRSSTSIENTASSPDGDESGAAHEKRPRKAGA